MNAGSVKIRCANYSKRVEKRAVRIECLPIASSRMQNFVVRVASFVLCCLLFVSCTSTTEPHDSQPATPTSGGTPSLSVYGVYPNPYKSKALLAYEISGGDAEKISIDLYNALGEKMRSYSFPSNDSLTISSFHSSSYPFSVGYSEFEINSATTGTISNGVFYYRITVEKGTEKISNTGSCLKVE